MDNPNVALNRSMDPDGLMIRILPPVYAYHVSEIQGLIDHLFKNDHPTTFDQHLSEPEWMNGMEMHTNLHMTWKLHKHLLTWMWEQDRRFSEEDMTAIQITHHRNILFNMAARRYLVEFDGHQEQTDCASLCCEYVEGTEQCKLLEAPWPDYLLGTVYLAESEHHGIGDTELASEEFRLPPPSDVVNIWHPDYPDVPPLPVPASLPSLEPTFQELPAMEPDPETSSLFADSTEDEATQESGRENPDPFDEDLDPEDVSITSSQDLAPNSVEFYQQGSDLIGHLCSRHQMTSALYPCSPIYHSSDGQSFRYELHRLQDIIFFRDTDSLPDTFDEAESIKQPINYLHEIRLYTGHEVTPDYFYKVIKKCYQRERRWKLVNSSRSESSPNRRCHNFMRYHDRWILAKRTSIVNGLVDRVSRNEMNWQPVFENDQVEMERQRQMEPPQVSEDNDGRNSSTIQNRTGLDNAPERCVKCSPVICCKSKAPSANMQHKTQVNGSTQSRKGSDSAIGDRNRIVTRSQNRLYIEPPTRPRLTEQALMATSEGDTTDPENVTPNLGRTRSQSRARTVFENIINLTPLNRVLPPDTTSDAMEAGEYVSIELPEGTVDEAVEE